jgi:hypothetical protein
MKQSAGFFSPSPQTPNMGFLRVPAPHPEELHHQLQLLILFHPFGLAGHFGVGEVEMLCSGGCCLSMMFAVSLHNCYCVVLCQ